MPNYCENELYVTGDATKIAEFHERFTKHASDGEPFSFIGFVPDPGTIQGRYDEWGTKWDVCFGVLGSDDENHKGYYFETAWSPPVPVIHAMQTQFPELRIELQYREDAIGFIGIVDSNGNDMTSSLV